MVACSSGSEVRTVSVELNGAMDDGYPWTQVLLPPQTPTTVPYGPAGTELPTEGGTGGIRVVGDRTGLYGGSPDRLLCDRQKLVDDLERDPARMTAWSGVFDVDDVRSYVRTLTPVLLRADTRVTDHGFEGGRAQPVQSVLEAGTIVLVDDHGVPRVRCVQGSPLLAPILGENSEMQGDPWPNFQEDRLLVVQPSNLAMNDIAVVDLMTGGLTPVPVGAGPGQPAERPRPPAPVISEAPVVDSPPIAVQQAAPRPAPATVAPPPPPPPPPQVELPPPPAPAPLPQPQIRVQIPGMPLLVIPIP